MANIEIDYVQQFVAYGSVGASTVRGLKTSGVVSACRTVLSTIELGAYAEVKKNDIADLLDLDTKMVLKRLPKSAQHWGVARKVLNIFLRGSLYNTYLNSAYRLSKHEFSFEIPLDSLSANGVRSRVPKDSRPKWVGVKHVTPEKNEIFQQLATEIAKQQKTARVHLDALFWAVDRLP